MYFNTREEELAFLKRLWQEEPVICPKCNGTQLEHLHKKAKKSNNDWECSACGEIYRTIDILRKISDR